jgi:hypothetical protein
VADVPLFEALEGDECYAYGTLVADAAGEAAAVKRRLAARLPNAVVSRLDPIIELPGAAASVPASFRYVVETDVLPGLEADFNLWYDRQHLPGLAAVPGTARACRFRDLDCSRRYHACHDVVSPSIVGSPSWIVVRGTGWSQRVRPAFRNTKRTMFRRRTP